MVRKIDDTGEIDDNQLFIESVRHSTMY